MTDDLKITLPSHVVGSGNLERLVRTARGYARCCRFREHSEGLQSGLDALWALVSNERR